MNECIRNDEPRSEGQGCLFCSFLKTVTTAREKHSAFHTHMYNARIEVLQAFRSLIDRHISTLEKRKDSAEGKKATKISVE
ncbi:MAG: hypothetical protein P4L43_07250 [Syntrophobacteraceae bacterium]|nr:hypothetical protein [Syntrophobacteraceae bacterium]